MVAFNHRKLAGSTEAHYKTHYQTLWAEMLSHLLGWSNEESLAWLKEKGLLTFTKNDTVYHDEPPLHLRGVVFMAFLGEDYDEKYSQFDFLKCYRNYIYGFDWFDLPLDFDWDSFIIGLMEIVSDAISKTSFSDDMEDQWDE